MNSSKYSLQYVIYRGDILGFEVSYWTGYTWSKHKKLAKKYTGNEAELERKAKSLNGKLTLW